MSDMTIIVPSDVERAVNHLLAAGMVLRFRSVYGASYYLGWPGRKGALRVSDHTSNKSHESGIHARVTLPPQSDPVPTDKLIKISAEALGRYLMATTGEGTVDVNTYRRPDRRDDPVTRHPDTCP